MNVVYRDPYGGPRFVIGLGVVMAALFGGSLLVDYLPGYVTALIALGIAAVVGAIVYWRYSRRRRA